MVWRSLELPGDLTLPRVHDAIQAAMGWTNSHLHRFRTGAEHNSPSFVTHFDVEEGDDGILEDDVRLDQLVAAAGDRLFYEYDFGDGRWEHVLTVEEVLSEPPHRARCVAGERACPPEDCGGIGGYEELATWARSGDDDSQLPGVFDSVAEARAWLPAGWHPDRFDVAEADEALAVATAEPVAVAGELAELVEQTARRGTTGLRETLGRPLSHAPAEVDGAEIVELTASYRIVLEVLGDGVALTGAGYLPPAVVEQIAERTGIAERWIGKANREDLTPPVAGLRDSAQALGLVAVRKGRIAPTAAGRRAVDDPERLWRHIVSRLPLGKGDFDRHAGWLTLAVVGSGEPAERWEAATGELLGQVGWRASRTSYDAPSARTRTLVVLEHLAGDHRRGRLPKGLHPAVAATARAVLQRG